MSYNVDSYENFEVHSHNVEESFYNYLGISMTLNEKCFVLVYSSVWFECPCNIIIALIMQPKPFDVMVWQQLFILEAMLCANIRAHDTWIRNISCNWFLLSSHSSHNRQGLAKCVIVHCGLCTLLLKKPYSWHIKSKQKYILLNPTLSHTSLWCIC